jgi:hypothetical protein
MPIANDKTAMLAKPGLPASKRNPYRTSCHDRSSQVHPSTVGVRSVIRLIEEPRALVVQETVINLFPDGFYSMGQKGLDLRRGVDGVPHAVDLRWRRDARNAEFRASLRADRRPGKNDKKHGDVAVRSKPVPLLLGAR